jgi:transposase
VVIGRSVTQEEKASMDKATIIGLDLAKRVFQAHGARADGGVAFREKLSRARVLPFLAEQPRCVVAMEACATAHEWGRAIVELGHEVRLIPPVYIKPFVKRQKNDAADAEAIAEAASRPTMRFVVVKTIEQQARGMIFRTRDLFVRQRTQLINALRGHLAEHGVVAPQGVANVKVLADAINNAECSLHPLVRGLGKLYLEQIATLGEKVRDLERTVRSEARAATTARLTTMPGIGPITAMAIETFAPPMETFKRGRDFAAWLGLVPKQHSTGGKQRLGRTSKMGQRDIRRLLIVGAMGVVRWACRNGASEGTWLARMLARKPRMIVAIALANKMARAVWAMLVRKENYRDPVTATA